MSWIMILLILLLAYVLLVVYLGCACLAKWRRKLMNFFTGREAEIEIRENARAQGVRPRIEGDLSQEECPICLEEIGQKGVFSLCAHFYCSKCIVKCIKLKQDGKIDCPYCRRKVTFLVIQNQEGPSDEELDCIRQYNLRHSEERGFIDNLRNAPFLIRQFWREVVETNGLLLVRRW